MNMFEDNANPTWKIRSARDCENLQRDLHRLQHCSDATLMKFNVGKSRLMKMGHSETRTDLDYYLRGIVLPESACERNLGVDAAPSLLPEVHTWRELKERNYISLTVKIAFKNMDEHMFKEIYATYVRPKLKYASPIWFHLKIKYRVAGESTMAGDKKCTRKKRGELQVED